jgi:N-acetylneuraminate lyase
MLLSEAERIGLAEAWVAARAKYGVRVLNHIGAQSITEARTLAEHSERIGCDAICAMAPQFFKPAGPMGLARWLQAIGAAAPKTPLY